MVALILDVRALLNRLQSDLTVGSAACISKSLQALVMSTPLLCSLTNQDLAPRHCDIDVPLARAPKRSNECHPRRRFALPLRSLQITSVALHFPSLFLFPPTGKRYPQSTARSVVIWPLEALLAETHR